MTDQEQQELDDLRRRFVYVSDVEDVWTLMENETGPLEGDCEDFSLTLLWRLSGRSWSKLWWNVLTMKGVIWHCRTSSGEAHAALRWQGKWICNIYPVFSKQPRHTLLLPYVAPLLAGKLLKSFLVKGK